MRALADYSTCLIQDDKLLIMTLTSIWACGGAALNESPAAYARGSGPENQWVSVGFGRLTFDNLRFGGTFDATTQSIAA